MASNPTAPAQDMSSNNTFDFLPVLQMVQNGQLDMDTAFNIITDIKVIKRLWLIAVKKRLNRAVFLFCVFQVLFKVRIRLDCS